MYNNKKGGHLINVVNFDHLIGICKSYDLIYKPSNNDYSISALELLSVKSKSVLATVSVKEIAYSRNTNERELVYYDLLRLSTRVLFAAKSAGITKLQIDDLVSANRKIQGRRAVAITANEKVILANQIVNKIADPNVVLLKKNNVSQMSYDRLNSNFSTLVEVLKANSEYLPNEEDLKIVSLDAKIELMNLVNQNVSNSSIGLSKARFERDNFMYLQENNLVDIALAVKDYTRSIFGARSIQNKQLSEMRFYKLKN